MIKQLLLKKNGSVLENCRKKINRKGRKGLRKGRKELQSVYMITIFYVDR
jgi:hypothetical protein